MAMTAQTDSILVIDLSPAWTDCHRCGKATPHKWGLPVDCETGNIVPTWFEGEWGGVPTCEACYEAHQRWSEELLRPFDAPLC
jgi:hypothetical protein